MQDKGLTDVYRLIGLAPQRKSGHAETEAAPTSADEATEATTFKAVPTMVEDAQTAPIPAGDPRQATTFNFGLCRTRGEPLTPC